MDSNEFKDAVDEVSRDDLVRALDVEETDSLTLAHELPREVSGRVSGEVPLEEPGDVDRVEQVSHDPELEMARGGERLDEQRDNESRVSESRRRLVVCAGELRRHSRRTGPLEGRSG